MIEKFSLVAAGCISASPFTPPGGVTIPANLPIWQNGGAVRGTGPIDLVLGSIILNEGEPYLDIKIPQAVTVMTGFPMVAFCDGTTKLSWSAAPSPASPPTPTFSGIPAGGSWTFSFFDAAGQPATPDGPVVVMVCSLGSPGVNA